MQHVFVQRDRDKDAWSETGGRRKRECGFPFRKLRAGRSTDLRIHRKRHLERALFRCRRTVSSHDTGLEKKVKFLLTGRKCDDIIILFSTVIEEKNERKAFEIGPNAHFYLDENVVWDLHFIIFFDICSMFLVNSISCPVEDGTAAPGNPVHPILYNRPDNRCPGNSPHSCSSMSPISDLV